MNNEDIKFAMSESVWLQARYFDIESAHVGQCFHVPKDEQFFTVVEASDKGIVFCPIFKTQQEPGQWHPHEEDRRLHTSSRMGGFWWIIDTEDARECFCRELNGMKIVGTLNLGDITDV